MKKLPEKQSKGSWVQTEREAHEAWAKLIRKSPKAAELMHLITARIGENNAVVMSIPTIMKLMATSRPTVVRAISLLREDRWIETVQIGGSGTTNAYVVNDRVAWTGPRDGIRFSLFSAAVIATDDEQIDRDKLGKQEPLRRLPQIGELQIPHGEGLPPPSQPFLDRPAQPIRPGEGCELASLIRVHDLGRAELVDGLVQCFDAEVGLQRVREPPGQNLAGVPVHDRHEV